MTPRAVHILELRSVVGAGGGPEKTILLGAQRSDPRKFRVTVCYLRDARDQGFAVRERAEALGVDYVEIVERTSFDVRVWRALRRLVRARGIDIIHAHDYKTDLLALMIARAEGIVPVATAHGWTGHSRRERWVYYPCDKRVIRAFPIAVAVSSQIKSDLVRAGMPASRVRVILNGIDHTAFRRDRTRETAARRELQLDDADLVIGSAGRLEPQKRFDLLIRAGATLRDRHPRLRLLIAGEGSMRPELERLAGEVMPAGACRLLGHRSDIRPLHHALDVFVQSSDYEGTPNAVLEAMALETPIVATAAGGTAEIAEPATHGLITPTGDLQALASAIDRALSEPGETAARARRARLRVETTLSFAARMSALEAIYEEAIGTRARRPALAVAGRCA
ncbi:MAG: glycosyltransferase [Vicinamibacterales bacterium]|jgi:glycosyltransferase involved in cell wall biosynthesis